MDVHGILSHHEILGLENRFLSHRASACLRPRLIPNASEWCMSSPNETRAPRCRPSRGARSRTFKCLKPEARPALSRIAGIKALSGATPNAQSGALKLVGK